VPNASSLRIEGPFAMSSDSNNHDPVESRARTSAYAEIARRERAAALRALAAQFAHQIRNQLAATRAVCDNLRVELDNSDHQQRLHLALNEIDRLLDSVSSTVQSLVETPEPARVLDAIGEVQEAVQIFIAGREDSVSVELVGEPVHCVLPAMGFRVAVYSLLEHLLQASAPASANIGVQRRDDQLQVCFRACGEKARELAVAKAPWPVEWPAGPRHIGLLVAERFARDLGGRLAHSLNENGCVQLTLELPFGVDASS
jgi:C4-dicarboxylate-specific signal transduction histidine kinase